MMKNKEPKYRCPNCNSDKLLVYEKTSFVLNTGEFYCHSIKSHDDDAEVRCQSIGCDWVGRLDEVINTEKGI
jgi:ssDNA-binding Zn-finger/Zn-ribbon topoisomerase 1